MVHVIATKNFNNQPSFQFSCAPVSYVKKLIKKLSAHKALQYTDIPVKILKQNSGSFAGYTYEYFNWSVKSGTFSNVVKLTNTTLV